MAGVLCDAAGVLYAQGGWAAAKSRTAENVTYGGSTLYVQTNASLFCMEPAVAHHNATTLAPMPELGYFCPEWAGGKGPSVVMNTTGSGWPHDYRGTHIGLDSGWIMLDFVKLSDTSIKVDLAPLKGAAPTAVRYAWGTYDCCDLSDPLLWVTHGCIAEGGRRRQERRKGE